MQCLNFRPSLFCSTTGEYFHAFSASVLFLKAVKATAMCSRAAILLASSRGVEAAPQEAALPAF